VAYAPLPYPATARPLSAQRALVRPPYRLIVFGYLGLNRRLEAVLQALADLPCRDQFHLDIFGSLPNRDWLWGLIRALGLKNHVSLHGFVEEARLKAALETAHLAINLRFPTMGEASASQLRIWDHALPSLVSRVGWYATLPADTVAFVDPQREVRDLQQHLLAFAAHPARYAQLGENGRRLLEEQHTPKGYVRCLLELAANTERFHARQGAHRLAQRAAALLPDCLGPTIPPSFYQRLGSAIHSLAAG
jgi:glycosyltransferase involved in cell wall biosynthesis